MKLLKRWYDKRNNITNFLYETSNGVKLLSAVNPTTTDIHISTVFRAGSCFEPLIGVPTGTAHFLEHLLCKPNRVFKTKRAIDEFEYGDRQHPGLNVNAATSKKYIYVTGYTNERGGDRLRKRLKTVLLYPSSLFKKYIEEEREIILAELVREPKPEKDRLLSSDEFSFGRFLPHFTHRILGSYEDVKRVTVADLEKFHKAMIGSQHVIFSCQTKTELSDEELEWFESVAVSLRDLEKPFLPPKESIENFYGTCAFTDDHDEGMFFSIRIFSPVRKKVDYRKEVLFELTGDLLNKISFDILREEKGLIYGFELFSKRALSFTYEMHGFTFTTEVEKAAEGLEAVYDLLYKRMVLFLKSKKAEKWFESAVSIYLFPHTKSYDPEYAEGRVVEIIEGNEIYLFGKSVPVAKKVTLADLLDYVKKELIAVPPHVWVTSPLSKARMENLLHKSAFEKRWGTKYLLRGAKELRSY